MLNILGLIASTFGAIMFAYYGPPPSRAVSEDGETFAPLMKLDEDDPEHRSIIWKNKIEYVTVKGRSNAAFVLILIGFVLQLVSASIDYWPKLVSIWACMAKVSG